MPMVLTWDTMVMHIHDGIIRCDFDYISREVVSVLMTTMMTKPITLPLAHAHRV